MELTGFGPCLPQFLPLGQPELNSRPPGVSSTLSLSLSLLPLLLTPLHPPSVKPSQRWRSGGSEGPLALGPWLQLRNCLTPSSCPSSPSVVLLWGLLLRDYKRWSLHEDTLVVLGSSAYNDVRCASGNGCPGNLSEVEGERANWACSGDSVLGVKGCQWPTSYCSFLYRSLHWYRQSHTLIHTPSRSMCLRTHSLAGIKALIYTHGLTHPALMIEHMHTYTPCGSVT